MNFSKFWDILQISLSQGDVIRNWTAAKGYLGDSFVIKAVSSKRVGIETPNAKTIQYVGRSDFEVMFSNWDAYTSGKLQRQKLRDMTRVSKYTMSVIKHLEEFLS